MGYPKGLLGSVALAVAILVLAGAAAAQQQSPAAAAPVNQGTSALLFAGEVPPNNLLTMGFTASGSWDDNPLGTTPAQSATLSLFSTHVQLNVDRPRWSANLRYDPEYSYSPDITGYNNVGHVAGGTFTYRPSRRLTIALRDDYSRTTNPNQMVSTSPSTPVFGASNQLNPTGFGQYLTLTTEQAGADISYALSAHSSIGFGGGYSSIQSSQPGAASASLQDMVSWSGHAYYSRQLSRRTTAGLQFRWEKIDLMGGTNEATPISIQYFHQVQFGRGFSFSLFGGPEMTNTVDNVSLAALLGLPAGFLTTNPVITIRDRQWSGSGGGTLNWSTQRNAASFSFVRQTGGGGAFGSITDSSIFTGNYRRQLTAHTSLNLTAGYTRNDSVGALNQVPIGNYFSGLAQCTRTLGPAQLTVSYARYQTGAAAAGVPQVLTGNHNQVMVSISYFFHRTLGR